VLFPVSYWPLIRKYSAANNLDPYMIAALIARNRPSPPMCARRRMPTV
jgi:hypothetical protein